MTNFGYTVPQKAAARRTIVHQQMDEASRRPASAEYVDLGSPVPESYDVDLLSALVQSPFRVNVFWEVSEKTWSSLKRVFGEARAGRSRAALLLRDVEAAWQGTIEIGLAASWWLEVYPNRTYELELGVLVEDGAFVKLLGPRRITTPAASPQPLQARERGDGFVPPRVLRPESVIDDLTTQIAGGAAHDLPPELLRSILRLLRGGVADSWDASSLPPWLRERLRAIGSAAGAGAARAALVEYLPEIGLIPGATPGAGEVEYEPAETFLLSGSSDIHIRPSRWGRWAPSLARPLVPGQR